VVALLALLGGAWLWIRDSSLVQVRTVTVTGLSGPDAARIRSALILAARNMTTLDVKNSELNTAVAPYPVVKSLKVSSQFPHGLRIRVVEEMPIGQIQIGGRAVPVASDGTLLHDAGRLPRLPLITLRTPPGGEQITAGEGHEIVALLAAAPYAMLSHVAQAGTSPAHGLTAQLRGGPAIFFGDAGRLHAKWAAAVAVLNASSSAGAEYIDVTDPQRPAAGANTASASTTSGTNTAAATTAASTTAAAPTGPTSTTASTAVVITPATAATTTATGASGTAP
jgi:cell division protein FtsQ